MSRSKRRTPVIGITLAASEKQDKQAYNRRYRRAFVQAIRKGGMESERLQLREYSNPWSMEKDGKTRFDPRKYPKLMRK